MYRPSNDRFTDNSKPTNNNPFNYPGNEHPSMNKMPMDNFQGPNNY